MSDGCKPVFFISVSSGDLVIIFFKFGKILYTVIGLFRESGKVVASRCSMSMCCCRCGLVCCHLASYSIINGYIFFFCVILGWLDNA